MDTRKHKLISEFDGLRLDVEEVVPDRIRGIVQISHGMAEHKERYEEFMKFLAEHDYMAVIHDHRGHGNSVNDLVELGYFYTEDIQGIIEDLHQITRWIKEQYPGLPIYLFSHSMGTLVARNYIKKYDDEIKKLQEWQKSIEDGNLTEPMETAIETWCTVHMPELLALAVKQVYFGLTDSGFFVAYIPDSWADIVFNTTGYDIVEELEPEYGHLVLSMEV